MIPEPERAKPKENTSNLMDSVVVGDTTGILYTLAACCKPIWGDEVVGYITRSGARPSTGRIAPSSTPAPCIPSAG
ncbi:MAG: hypothetical protein IPP58_09320 [Holophagaceae bacterium]|uniref:Uncharacterized protein n=1 Tax=Candidatus Geothrix skivensis TaxID=2954439 RepID=A0A9D7XIH0_9BACT|nr:hypothetical protein [Candidatus Geothrix skivensis]